MAIMDTLFDIKRDYPEGFEYYPDFISVAEEKELIQQIKQIELHHMIYQGFEAKRKVASFGYDYSFDKRSLSKGKDIPPAFHALIKKVAEYITVDEKEIAELLVTEYPVGSVINWHRDAPPFDLIAGISLNADCVFKLRPHEKALQNRASLISIPVKRRSLYILKGAARSEWQHSIAPAKEVRYSITLRTLKKEI